MAIDPTEDPHDVTGALKKYLRSLEKPIVPANLYDEFISFDSTPRLICCFIFLGSNAPERIVSLRRERAVRIRRLQQATE